MGVKFNNGSTEMPSKDFEVMEKWMEQADC